MKVSPNFQRREFSCHCGCGFEAVDVELIKILEELRLFFDRPVHINSGCRCEKWNKRVGGKKSSYHTKGMAADIRVEYTPSHLVQDYLFDNYPNKYGIGSYKTFTHIDVRRKKARWEGED